jgi:hypothetical protein
MKPTALITGITGQDGAYLAGGVDGPRSFVAVARLAIGRKAG